VIQLPSAPIEAGRIINIRHSIYSGTDRVQLNFFSKNRINIIIIIIIIIIIFFYPR